MRHLRPIDWILLAAFIALIFAGPALFERLGLDNTSCADLRGPEGCK
jgi:hypothetical protein